MLVELPYFVAIDRALRDEGASYLSTPLPEIAEAEPELVAEATALTHLALHAAGGASWTADAPFREMAEAI